MCGLVGVFVFGGLGLGVGVGLWWLSHGFVLRGVGLVGIVEIVRGLESPQHEKEKKGKEMSEVQNWREGLKDGYANALDFTKFTKAHNGTLDDVIRFLEERVTTLTQQNQEQEQEK